jgi:hypothetical protein
VRQARQQFTAVTAGSTTSQTFAGPGAFSSESPKTVHGLKARRRPPQRTAAGLEPVRCLLAQYRPPRQPMPLEVVKMTLANRSLKALGRFAIGLKSWVIGGPADEAHTAQRYAYRDGSQRPCPGPYALLAGVPRR